MVLKTHSTSKSKSRRLKVPKGFQAPYSTESCKFAHLIDKEKYPNHRT